MPTTIIAFLLLLHDSNRTAKMCRIHRREDCPDSLGALIRSVLAFIAYLRSAGAKRLDTPARSCNRLIERMRNKMQGNPRGLITSAERRFPVRIRIAVPPEGLGRQHARMTAWLDENCGADG